MVEETTLRCRDLIPASRFRQEKTWIKVVSRKARKAASTITRPPPIKRSRDGAPVTRGAYQGGKKTVKPPSGAQLPVFSVLRLFTARRLQWVEANPH